MRMALPDPDRLLDCLHELDPNLSGQMRQTLERQQAFEDGVRKVRTTVEVSLSLRQADRLIACCDRVEQTWADMADREEEDSERVDGFLKLKYFLQDYRMRVQRDSMHLRTVELYEDLSAEALLKDRLRYLRTGSPDNPFSEDCIRVDFHKYLRLSICLLDSWTCTVDCGATYWKLPIRKLRDYLVSIAQGHTVFIERTGAFHRLFESCVRTVPEEEYLHKKQSLCRRSDIRIYTGNGILYEA